MASEKTKTGMTWDRVESEKGGYEMPAEEAAGPGDPSGVHVSAGRYLARRLWLLIITLALAAVAGFILSEFMREDVYESVYVADLGGDTDRATQYAADACSDPVLSAAAQSMHLPYGAEGLRDRVRAVADSKGRVLVTVKAAEPRLAQQIAKAVADAASENAASEELTLAAAPTLPGARSAPEPIRDALWAALAAGLLLYVILAAIFVIRGPSKEDREDAAEREKRRREKEELKAEKEKEAQKAQELEARKAAERTAPRTPGGGEDDLEMLDGTDLEKELEADAQKEARRKARKEKRADKVRKPVKEEPAKDAPVKPAEPGEDAKAGPKNSPKKEAEDEDDDLTYLEI